jgi:hypothetical protein
MSANRPTSTTGRPALLLGGAGGLLVAATLGLWGWYGTAVFFEALRAGWAACF